jgi:hypothetical protein
MRRSAPSASGWSHPVFLRRFGSGGQLGVLFAQRAHGGSFAALFLYMLFTLSLQRGDLRRQFARRFSKLFLRRFSGSAQIRILFPQSVNRTLCFILITFFLTTSCFCGVFLSGLSLFCLDETDSPLAAPEAGGLFISSFDILSRKSPGSARAGNTIIRVKEQIQSQDLVDCIYSVSPYRPSSGQPILEFSFSCPAFKLFN